MHRGGQARRRRLPSTRFRYITVPALKPILLILTSLSVLWDFRVFTQIYVLQQAGGITRDTNLLGRLLRTTLLDRRRADYDDTAAAIGAWSMDADSLRPRCTLWLPALDRSQAGGVHAVIEAAADASP